MEKKKAAALKIISRCLEEAVFEVPSHVLRLAWGPDEENIVVCRQLGRNFIKQILGGTLPPPQ